MGDDRAIELSGSNQPAPPDDQPGSIPQPMLLQARTQGMGLYYGDTYCLLYSKGRGEDIFFIAKGTSRKKLVEEFPLTQQGWRDAFTAFAKLEPEEAERALAKSRVFETSESWRQTVAQALGYMPSSLYLGGHGVLGLRTGGYYDLLFDDDGLHAVKDTAKLIGIPYAEMQGMEISGRGALTSGGGFIGGGFGLEGVLTGMAIASLLNAATTQTHMETVLRIETADAEAFFHYGNATPERLRIELSAAFGRLKRQTGEERLASPALAAGAGVQDDAGIGDQLAKLADLFREGLLSQDEFDAAKRRLLGVG